MKKLFVVDAMGFIFRSYHAIGRMTNPQGASTNALYGFIRSVLKLIKDFSPEHLVIVFDGPYNDRSRKALYPAYKENRGETPGDLLPQFDWAREFCRLKGLSTLTLEGVEADDTMAAIALWAKDQEIHTYLCTSDKDMAQLVSPQISILNVFKENLILDPQGIVDVYGLAAEKIGDYLAILGDTSDNIPGVPSIGPKGAQELISLYGSIDGIVANLDQIKGKRGEAIRNNLEQLRLSRKLIELQTDLEIPKELSFYEIGPHDIQGLKELFTTHAFRTLLVDLAETEAPKAVVHKAAKIIQTEVELTKLVAHLQSVEHFCFDTETTSERALSAEIVGMGFGTSEEDIWYVPLNGSLPKDKILSALKPLLETKSLVGHNIKYDMHILKGLGIEPKTPFFDTMVASYVIQADEREHNLDTLALKHFDRSKIPLQSLIGKGAASINLADVPIEKVATYCSEDIEMTLALQQLFTKELDKRHLAPLFQTVELPLIPVLTQMEQTGIYLDTAILSELGERVKNASKLLEETIFHLAGGSFNLNSPKQLSEILFEKLQIAPPKKTKTGFSTNAEVLELLTDKHPMIPLILEYRTLEKLRSTYIDTLPLEINPKTGRIHCTFNQSVAATGRLSCQDPNLQNIPIRNPLGKEIRAAFRPQKEGWSFVSADYSQIELRLLAHFSQDPLLMEAFKSGGDIHRRTAAALMNIFPEEVTPDMRSRAKAVNFGIIYGQQAFGLSRELNISVKEADKFIQLYFEKYSKVKDYLERSKEEARATGYARTMLGRERKISDIHNPNPQIRQAAERLAINTPLQGSQADLIKIAMITIDKRLKKEGLKSMMLLQIHDELMFEVPDEELETMKSLLKEEMEGAFSLSVPLTVEVNVGKNWKDC